MKKNKEPAAISLLLGCVLFVCSGCNNSFRGGNMFAGSSEDAQYTILMKEFSGPNAGELAKLHKKRAPEYTGWTDIELVYKSNTYQLLRGLYPSRNEAMADLDEVQSWRSPQGKQLFSDARIIAIPGEDVGPKEWNLKYVKEGYYSYQVAVFFDMYKKDYPDLRSDYVGRKKFAVQYCSRLRRHGYEAYFYHGPTNSIVSIGTFDKKAMQTKQIAVYHPETGDKTFREKHLTISKEMKKLQKKFPHMQINGTGQSEMWINPVTRRSEKHLQRTYAIIIPGRKGVPEKLKAADTVRRKR